MASQQPSVSCPMPKACCSHFDRVEPRVSLVFSRHNNSTNNSNCYHLSSSCHFCWKFANELLNWNFKISKLTFSFVFRLTITISKRFLFDRNISTFPTIYRKEQISKNVQAMSQFDRNHIQIDIKYLSFLWYYYHNYMLLHEK